MLIKRLSAIIAGLALGINAILPLSAGATSPPPKLNGRIAISTTLGPGGKDIYSVKADGTSPLQLTAGSVNSMLNQTPAYSPDGKKIAYSSRESGDQDIWMMNADGSSQTRLTTATGYEAFPSWSPSGNKIVFSGQKFYAGPNSYRFTLQVMNPDGTGLTALSDNSSGIDDFGPSWSPDGTKIAFIRVISGQGSQVYIYDTIATTFTKISNFAGAGGATRNVSWSPDGSQLVTSSDPTGSKALIYTMNADGSNTQALNFCNTDDDSLSPTYSPDGKKLLFITECGFGQGNRHAVVTDIDGSNPVFLGASSESEDGVSGWQPLPLTSSAVSGDGTTTNTVDDDNSTLDYEVDDDGNGHKTVFVVNGKVGQVNVNSNGVLKGHGTIVVGVTVKSGGKLAPGNSPGCISTGTLALNSGSTYEAEIAGTTVCTQYDQTVVTGTVDLGSATLSTLLLNNFVGSQGNTFTIVNNDGADAVTGTFNGLAEGSTFTVGGTIFKISYVGGDGNDVVLTVMNVPALASTTTPAAPNTGMKLITSNWALTLVTTSICSLALLAIARRYNKA